MRRAVRPAAIEARTNRSFRAANVGADGLQQSRHHLGLYPQENKFTPGGHRLVVRGLTAQLVGQGLGLGRGAVSKQHRRSPGPLHRRLGQGPAHLAGA